MGGRAAKLWVVLVWAGLGAPASPAQPVIFEEPLSPRIANYHIVARLDDAKKHITGSLTLTWHNPSDDSIGALHFHLYWNAFKNARSTFIREWIENKAFGRRGSGPVEIPWEKDDGWGWTRVRQMKVNGADATRGIEYIQPDDGNEDDQTVIRVPLEKPIGPRGRATVEVEFESRIPKCKVRTGWWQEDFFFIAHWFPKIGVYEPPGTRLVPPGATRGAWNCHQFHAATEFYSDYGVYDVEITLPEKYLVGMTGLIVEERSNGDGTKTVVAHAEDVHEFAWVADAHFRERTVEWRSPRDQRSVDVRLLYQPAHEDVVDKYLASTVFSLGYVDDWLGDGAYPYPNLTVVDPRPGSAAGGMEYPTLFTGGARWWVEKLFGDGVRFVESVTIHEFMHQIWYGVVGSNEFEEAWLDEGLTTFSEMRISSALFGKHRSTIDWWGIHAGDFGMRRRDLVEAAGRLDAAIVDPTYAHWHRGLARDLAYDKTSLMLYTLQEYLGRERFDRVMRTYYQRWKFAHPSREDFFAVANETAGENLNWFFDQLVRTDLSLDYAVASVANVPVETFEKGLEGFRPGPPESEETDEDDEDEKEPAAYRSTVVFRRAGEAVFPVDIEVEFADGHVVREKWNGRGRTRKLEFERPAKIVRAAIDAEHKVPLDWNRLNNSVRVDPHDFVTDKYTLKGIFWMQSFLQGLSFLN